ncbi:MAG: ABC transporter ATP-binding protein [Peptostreptococcaceae bacterium]|nr:ABC transporter ATP-binding protein [Peptostreptococcaceae bacterium]MDY5739124.1 ABC transporter ATP-binding protein [Anaerovoracaceae bacterium]
MEKEIRTVLQFYKPYTKWIILAMIFLIGRVAGELALPALMADIIDNGILEENIGYIYKTGAVMIIITALASLSAVTCGFFAAKVSAYVAADLREGIFTKVTSFGPYEMGSFGAPSLITRTTGDIQQIQQTTVMFMRMAAFAPLMGVGALLQAIRTNVGLGSVILLSLIAIFGVIAVIFVTTISKFERVQKILDKLNLIIGERLSGNQVVRAFRTEKREEKRFGRVNDEYRRINLFISRAMSTMMPILFFIMEVTTLAVVWVGSKFVISGSLKVGQIPAFIQYTTLVIMSFVFLTVIFILVPRAMVSMKRIGQVLETETIVEDNSSDAESRDLSEAIQASGRGSNKPALEFRAVDFTYPKASGKALSNISFSIKPGETVAIIGSTGSGKTSIINLIPRFYDPSSGDIFVNGTNIKEMSLYKLREEISLVPQSSSLFSGSIRENLTLGQKDKKSESDINKALRAAMAKDFVDERENKAESTISQGGSDLSGGQRQRLSIARALLKNSRILLLDDCFSALDFNTDKKLRHAIKENYRDKAVLLVGQRISGIMDADKILVLEEGKIVGSGTHSELLESCRVYKEIAISQLDLGEEEKSEEI